jgi:hypothetical protein
VVVAVTGVATSGFSVGEPQAAPNVKTMGNV